MSVLEGSIIRVCERYGVEAFRTKDTGVWCHSPPSPDYGHSQGRAYSTADPNSGGDKKIGSIGIHLRRNITSHGIAINITNEVMQYFNMIDACGLGKGVTSLEEMGVSGRTREDVEKYWVGVLAEELEGDVYKLRDIGELEEIWGLKRGEILHLMIQSDLHDI